MRLVIALLLVGLMASPALSRPHEGHRGGWGRWHPPYHRYHNPDPGVLGGFIGGIVGGWLGSRVREWCILPDGQKVPCEE
jgi:hypothetical protein